MNYTDFVLHGHADCILCVAITSDDQYLVSGSADLTVRLWNLYEKRQEAVLRRP